MENYKHSEEFKEKRKSIQTGKKMSDETKRKISESVKKHKAMSNGDISTSYGNEYIKPKYIK